MRGDVTGAEFALAGLRWFPPRACPVRVRRFADAWRRREGTPAYSTVPLTSERRAITLAQAHDALRTLLRQPPPQRSPLQVAHALRSWSVLWRDATQLRLWEERARELGVTNVEVARQALQASVEHMLAALITATGLPLLGPDETADPWVERLRDEARTRWLQAVDDAALPLAPSSEPPAPPGLWPSWLAWTRLLTAYDHAANCGGADMRALAFRSVRRDVYEYGRRLLWSTYPNTARAIFAWTWSEAQAIGLEEGSSRDTYRTSAAL